MNAAKTPDAPDVTRLLRREDALHYVSLGIATLRRMVKSASFSASVPFGSQAIGSTEEDVTHWVLSRAPTRMVSTDKATRA